MARGGRPRGEEEGGGRRSKDDREAQKGGGEDTLSVNTDTFALDNFLTGTYALSPFDLDIYSGAPGSDTSELLFTVPSLFQFGVDDVAGTLTPLYSFDPADFISPDIGLGSI